MSTFLLFLIIWGRMGLCSSFTILFSSMARRVKDIYSNDFESAADAWENSRKRPLPALAMLLPYSKGDVVLDAGCGNGRNTLVLASYFDKVYGVDLSHKLIEYAKKRLGEKAELAVGNVVALPYEREVFDSVFSLAVFHHLDNKIDRMKAFKEMHRVLKKGGFFLLSVRSKYENKVKGKKVIYTDWLGSSVYNYLYGEAELKNFAKKAGFKIVKCFWEKNGREVDKKVSSNLCLILQKVKTK